MNFRNISSWCIRNPVAPIVLFVGLMLAGLVAFARMQVNNNPDIDFPAAIVIGQRSRAPRRPRSRRRSRSGSKPRSAASTASTRSTAPSPRATARPSSSSSIGTPTDRAVNDVRNAIAQIRGNLPDGILEPQVTRVDADGRADLATSAPQTTDMTLEQLSWYIDNTVAKRLLGLPGIAAVSRVGGVDREIRVILDPARAAGAGHHRSRGQPAASPEQHERAPAAAPRSPAPNSRCACSAMPRTPTSWRRRRSRSPAAASSSSPISARSRTAIPSSARSRR